MMTLATRTLAAILALAPGAWGDDYGRALDVARDIAAASRNDAEAATLVAVAWMESGFLASVDSEERLGDSGAARGIFQLHNARHLSGDRAAQAQEAATRIRGSFGVCVALPWEERLSAYASGSCERGGAASRARLAVAKRVLARMRAEQE